MSLTAGDKLGPYEILGLIGAGGMGEVYKLVIHDWTVLLPSKSPKNSSPSALNVKHAPSPR